MAADSDSSSNFTKSGPSKIGLPRRSRQQPLQLQQQPQVQAAVGGTSFPRRPEPGKVKLKLPKRCRHAFGARRTLVCQSGREKAARASLKKMSNRLSTAYLNQGEALTMTVEKVIAEKRLSKKSQKEIRQKLRQGIPQRKGFGLLAKASVAVRALMKAKAGQSSDFQILEMAFDTKRFGKNARADKHQKSQRQLARNIKGTSYAHLLSSGFLLNKVAEVSESKAGLVDFVTDDLRFDETQQRLRMSLGALLLSSQMSNATHVGVFLRAIRWQVTKAPGKSQIYVFDVVHTPVAMLSTSAGCLHCVLRTLPGTGSPSYFEGQFDRIARTARYGNLRLRTVDGASSIERFLHWELLSLVDSDSSYHASNHCDFHCESLISNTVSTSVFAEPAQEKGAEGDKRRGHVAFHQDMYIMSRFFIAGSTWLRILFSIAASISGSVEVKQGPPPPDCGHVIMEIFEFCRFKHKRGAIHKACWEEGVFTKENPHTWWVDLLFVASVLNGEWWEQCCTGKFVHYCNGCCVDKAHTVRKIVICFLRCFFRSKPGIPALSRWLTMGKALDFYVPAVCSGALRLFTLAGCEAIVKQYGEPGEMQAPSMHTDPDFVRDFNWGKVQGGRAARTKKVLGQLRIAGMMVIYAWVHAPMRFLNAWQLWATKREGDPCETRPILDFLTDRFSPIVRICQHYRWLLICPNNRRLAAMRFADYTSWGEFQETPLHRRFRSGVYTSDSWHWYRYTKKYRRGPFPLARASDNRLSEKEREVANQEFVDLGWCCSCWGVGKKLKRSGAIMCAGDFSKPNVKALCTELGNARTNNSGPECCHARAQQHNHPANSWESFVADFVLSEVAARGLDAGPGKSSEADRAEESGAGRHHSESADQAEESEEQTLSGFNGKQVYHQVCIKADKVAAASEGRQGLGAAKLWPQVIQKWERLSDEEKAAYEAIGAENAAKKRRVDKSTSLAQGLGDEPQGAPLPIEPIGATVPMEVEQLQPEEKCCHCGVIGKLRPPIAVNAALALRREADGSVSKYPLAVERLADAKAGAGGISGLSKAMRQRICKVGRDLGGIPETLKPLPVCGLVCRKKWATSIGKAMKKAFNKIVADIGGPTKVVELLPCWI